MRKILVLAGLLLLFVPAMARADLLMYGPIIYWEDDVPYNWTLGKAHPIGVCVSNTGNETVWGRIGLTIGISNATSTDYEYYPGKYSFSKYCNGGTEPSCYIDDYNVSPCVPPDGVFVYIGPIPNGTMFCDNVTYQVKEEVFSVGDVLDLVVGVWYHECPLTLDDWSDGHLYKGIIHVAAPPTTACTRYPPTISVDGSEKNATRGETVQYTFTVTNEDPELCGASTFSFEVTCPSGLTCTLSKTSDTINPGLSTTVTLTINVPEDASYSTYTIDFRATNLASSLSSVLSVYLNVVPAVLEAKITKVTLDKVPVYSTGPYSYFDSDYWVLQGEIRNISITYVNLGEEPATYLIGMTIAEWVQPGVGVSDVFCNEVCYADGYEYCDANGVCHKWVDLVTVIGGATKTSTIPFHFRSDIFEPYKTYQIGAAIWRFENQTYPFIPEPLEYWMLDSAVSQQNVTIVPFKPPPQGTKLTITKISVSDEEPTFDDVVRVRIYIRNDGLTKIDTAYVGLSLIQGNNVCNRKCYVDNLGDYANISDIAPGDIIYVERLFRIDRDVFTNGSAYFLSGVYVDEYIPREYALDLKNKTITIVSPEEKLNACPIKLVAEKKEVGRGERVEYTAYVENRNYPWNFTLGMSIGVWDASSGVEYSSPQPYIIAPCNIECYRDKDRYGEFVFLYIPRGQIAYFTRSFEIPDYFPLDSYLDVGVGVWRSVSLDPKTGNLIGEGPICFVYFKNVSLITERYTLTGATGSTIKAIHEGLVNSLMRGFNLHELAARFLLWSIYSILVSFGVGYLGMRMGADGGSVLMVAGILACILYIAGVVAGQIPWWIGFIFIIIAGYLFSRILGGYIG